MLSFRDYKEKISKSVHYHIENKIPLAENIYRLHSEEFYKLFREARELFNEGILQVDSSWDRQLLESDIGEFGIYEDKKVPLDIPIEEEEKNPPLNKPRELHILYKTSAIDVFPHPGGPERTQFRK